MNSVRVAIDPRGVPKSQRFALLSEPLSGDPLADTLDQIPHGPDRHFSSCTERAKSRRDLKVITPKARRESGQHPFEFGTK